MKRLDLNLSFLVGERRGGRCMYVSMYATMDVVYKAFI